GPRSARRRSSGRRGPACRPGCAVGARSPATRAPPARARPRSAPRRRRRPRRREGPLDRAGVALGLPALERLAALALDLGIGGEDPPVGAGGEGRVLALGEAVLAHDLELAPLDPGHALAVRLDEPRLHVG